MSVEDKVFVQNQTGPHPTKWDRSGVIVECRDHNQYLVKLVVTGRVALRNRQFLRRYTLPNPLNVHSTNRMLEAGLPFVMNNIEKDPGSSIVPSQETTGFEKAQKRTQTSTLSIVQHENLDSVPFPEMGTTTMTQFGYQSSSDKLPAIGAGPSPELDSVPDTPGVTADVPVDSRLTRVRRQPKKYKKLDMDIPWSSMRKREQLYKKIIKSKEIQGNKKSNSEPM